MKTMLVLGWFPPLEHCSGLILTNNGYPVAYSQSLENSGHSHTFHEIIEIEEYDCITVVCKNFVWTQEVLGKVLWMQQAIRSFLNHTSEATFHVSFLLDRVVTTFVTRIFS